MPEQQLTERELATVLAALRHWQTALPENVEAYAEIATDGGRFEPLSVDEIDELCMKLNPHRTECRIAFSLQHQFNPN